MKYIATFHTHLSAMLTARSLERAGVSCRLIPVPRELSSSCGTALEYEYHSSPCLELMDADVERVFELQENGYSVLFENE